MVESSVRLLGINGAELVEEVIQDGWGGREKANLFYIHSSSASRTSVLITNFIMVPILQK
jgi:hypothetical protein